MSTISVIHKPHDKFFSTSMKDTKVALDFFKAHLPATILAQVDLSTLVLQDNTFIDSSQQLVEADIIYAVNLNGRLAYFYLLCEHQSKVVQDMAFRLLVYKVRLMEYHHRQHPKDPLPVVYSMVVYTGQAIWDAPFDFFDLFGEDAELGRTIFSQSYQLIDVCRLSDEELRTRDLIGLVEFAFKYRHQKDVEALMEVLPWITAIHRKVGNEFVEIVLNYSVSNLEVKDRKLFFQKANECLPEDIRDKVMTLAQQLKLEGRQEGILEGKLEIARRLLGQKVSINKIIEITGLSKDQIESIDDELH